METVFGLMLMLLGLCQGVVHECHVRTNVTCYGALGGSVLLRTGPKPDRIRIYRYPIVIFDRKHYGISSNYFKDRSVFNHEDGTFKINNLSSYDAGNYTFHTLDSTGRSLWESSLQLFLQDPVTFAQLHTEGRGLRVSCSHVGGDSPHLTWTLDGRTLTDDQLISGHPQMNNITLRPDVSGTLTCSVTNKVSRVDTVIKILNNAQSCQKKPNWAEIRLILWVEGGVLAALMILLMVGGVAVYTQEKKKSKKEEDDEQDECGEIKLVPGPWRTVGSMSVCVYTKFR